MKANDKKIWMAGCRELLSLGVTDIHTDPELEKESAGWNIYFAAQYGATPVVVQYNYLHGLNGGDVLVGFKPHGQFLIALTPQWAAEHENTLYKFTGFRLEFRLCPR